MPPTNTPGKALGDVNNDGRVNSVDSALILQHVARLITLSPERLDNADVNLDDEVNSVDSALILQFVADLICCLPPPGAGSGGVAAALEGLLGW